MRVGAALILFSSGFAAALRNPAGVPITRRTAAVSLLSLPAVWLPKSARAGPFDQGPLQELGNLRGIKVRRDESC